MTPTVALYGGSFNPPHVAHVMATRHVLTEEQVDQVWWMPVHQHAFDDKQGNVAFHHRVAMCELATADFGERVRVSTIEAELPGRNRTIDTLDALEERHPDTRFRLVIGADVFRESHLWKSFDELGRRAPFIVLGRAGHSVPPPWTACPDLPDIRSSHIRQRLEQGETAIEEIPPTVGQYIHTHHLYAEGTS